jgi:hypothetical protein
MHGIEKKCIHGFDQGTWKEETTWKM